MNPADKPATAIPGPPPLSNPHSNHRLVKGPLYESYEELEADLFAFTRAAGFAVVKKRSRNYRDGKPTTIQLACSKRTLKQITSARLPLSRLAVHGKLKPSLAHQITGRGCLECVRATTTTTTMSLSGTLPLPLAYAV
ncbi:hypothetical protein F4804DRAFT_321620 [Jackrogersella minutella]|nr:hypothetical protein F4804DRAFT_321620 [Jackrogersella minutella]